MATIDHVLYFHIPTDNGAEVNLTKRGWNTEEHSSRSHCQLISEAATTTLPFMFLKIYLRTMDSIKLAFTLTPACLN